MLAQMDTARDLPSQAKALIQRVWRESNDKFGFGSLSGAVYDSAWVSMIIKEGNSREWLFPECFFYVLDAQCANGIWDAGASEIDIILNTAASLLSLRRHMREPLQLQVVDRAELQSRIDRGIKALQHHLDCWDVLSSSHVGFEILVPAILKFLEDEGVSFSFPGRPLLNEINRTKLSAFKPEVLYSTYKTSLLHSLEAFIGRINFDLVAHHKVIGSMMASPSSSAAYLMNATKWDTETEDYLSHVVRSRGNGSVPSAFPTTYFEYSWTLSTLRRSGFTLANLACPELDMISKTLFNAFRQSNGTIGFAPNVGADVDDTAKGLFAMSMLQIDESDELPCNLSAFEVDTHFQTYPGERDPSLSANCNVLIALLHQKEVSTYSSQISKIVNFLVEHWWRSDEQVQDKWNSSSLYPRLLLVEAVSDFFNLTSKGALPNLLTSMTRSKLSIITFQACYRTLLEQHSNGSWNNSPEQTAYAVLILSESRNLPAFAPIRQNALAAMKSGAQYLTSLDLSELPPDFTWIEKVTYASSLLSSCYVLAALKSSASVSEKGEAYQDADATTHAGSCSSDYTKLIQQTPMFSRMPEYELQGSIIEGSLFRPLLSARRLEIFPRSNMSEDKYFSIIPLTWTACNNRSRTFASPALLHEMMTISFLNFQVDEFIESVAAPSFATNPETLRQLIESLFSHGAVAMSLEGSDSTAMQPLSRFVAHVLHHPQIAGSSSWDYRSLRTELRKFLLAHTKQAEESYRLPIGIPGTVYREAESTFYAWVRSTSADHTSCPYSFSFLNCLLSNMMEGSECFPTAGLKYFAEAACRHLASMCRMYNDYGSVGRDAEEGNLNSVNFPEFEVPGFAHLMPEAPSSGSLHKKKAALLQLAEYERTGLDGAMNRIEEEIKEHRGNVTVAKSGRRNLMIWKMFCDVTDLYGQIYCVKDIASRMK